MSSTNLDGEADTATAQGDNAAVTLLGFMGITYVDQI